MSEAIPSWLPRDLKEKLKEPDSSPTPLQKRLCASPEMRTIWEFLKDQFSDADRRDSELSKYGIPNPKARIYVPGGGYHFLSLLTFPETELGPIGSLSPKEREERLSEIRKTTLNLKRLLQGAELIEPSKGDLVSRELGKDPLDAVRNQIVDRMEFAKTIGIDLKIAFQVSPDGSVERLDSNYPHSHLADILDDVIWWADHYGTSADFFRAPAVISQSGDKANQDSYLFVLDGLLKRAGFHLMPKHYASILSTVFNLTAGGPNADAVKKRLQRLKEKNVESPWLPKSSDKQNAD